MTAPNPIRTGGEIDALCNRCELNLAHTIIAMVGQKVVKVKCNTCGTEHAYKGTQPLVKAAGFAKPKKAPAKPKAEKVVIAWEEQFKGKDIAAAKKYSTKEHFQVDEIIDHPTFGLGLVIAMRDDKVYVTFKTGEKTLVNGKAPPPLPGSVPPKRFRGRPGMGPKPGVPVAKAADEPPAAEEDEEKEKDGEEDEDADADTAKDAEAGGDAE